MKKIVVTVALCISGFRLADRCAAQTIPAGGPVTQVPVSLTGNEILLELHDFRGQMPDGIYAVDVTNDGGKRAEPRLVVKNAHRPSWSPHHKRFAYEFNRQLWLCDLNGKRVPFVTLPPAPYVRGNDVSAHWAIDGTLYYLLHSPVTGTRVAIGRKAESVDIDRLKANPDETLSTSFSTIIPLSRLVPSGQGLSDSSLRWSEILATGHASFSPDGHSMVAESYPSSPYDLARSQSKVWVYEITSWRGDAAHEKELILETQKRFGFEGALTPMPNSPRRLTKTESNSTEIKPNWSPSGDWIAFSQVDLSTGSVRTFVTRPDGRDLIEMRGPKKGLSEDWNPVAGSEESVKSQPPLSKAGDIWGDINREIVTWSEDGKYLWMREADGGISVAKQEAGKWLIRSAVMRTTSAYVPRYAFRGAKVSWIEDTQDVRGVYAINTFDIETGATARLELRPALEIAAVDW